MQTHIYRATIRLLFSKKIPILYQVFTGMIPFLHPWMACEKKNKSHLDIQLEGQPNPRTCLDSWGVGVGPCFRAQICGSVGYNLGWSSQDSTRMSLRLKEWNSQLIGPTYLKYEMFKIDALRVYRIFPNFALAGVCPTIRFII